MRRLRAAPSFTTADDLAKQVLASAVLDALIAAGTPPKKKPRNLPLLSLGPLFAERDKALDPDLNTWFLQWIDWIGVSAKFNLAWHYAWGGRGGFERIWTGPAAGVGRDGRAAARRCGHS